MRKTIRRIIYILPLFMAWGCDKAEEGYWPGTEPSNPLSTDVAEIYLNADGTAQDVNINAICSWDATLTENDNVFKISPASGDGDGTISVSAGSNYGGSVKSSSLVITARELSKQVTVNIMQSSLTFEMAEREYKTIGEEGGEVELSFNSTTGWEFLVRANSADPEDVGSLDWLDFTPGYKGDGDFYETKVVANWKPNYTLQEREITLVLTPTNQNILEYLTTALPQPFVLRQSAGTLPTNIAACVGEVGYTDVSMRMSYSSVTSVSECGVRVLNDSGDILMNVSAEKTGDEYPRNGEVQVNITGLEEGNSYRLEPYVRNMVGETKSEQIIEVTTNKDIEYEGVKIIDYIITPAENMVTVSVSVSSDINVYEGGIGIYNEENVDEPLTTYTTRLEGMELTFEISSVDFLNPNTEYELVIFVRTDINEVRTEKLKFTTEGRHPGEDDMSTPDVE